MIFSKPTIKFLGVALDAKLSFKGHTLYACEKVAKATTALARVMPNVGGPKHCNRLLIAGVVWSKLLNAWPAWAEALDNV